ncbi:hypothetical protein Terro_3094 [Terriglobus roseus DSM 18391]|uniref:Uncharacterized protein n=2 Tax=Terriglobus roseus TaxID=392734 RepID=I3ZJA7_TERRK|nr:hypothetical protein Terro_3094 [Terriglobus roseus DSM 18391]
MSYPSPRWARCIMHRDGQAPQFLREWFSSESKKAFFIGGAGFDPRSTAVARFLKHLAKCAITGILIREHRPLAPAHLLAGAEKNIAELLQLIPNLQIRDIDIFADNDLALVGGRQAAKIAKAIDWENATDIVVDCSALSRGVIFPLVRSILEISSTPVNLHLLVIDNASLDDGIVAEPAERASTMHGFRGRLGLESSQHSAVLWLPQLVPGHKDSLSKIHSSLEPKPHDICPILPFPSRDLRKPELLITEYSVELESTWGVDPRNVVFASESNPLDLYRSILRIDDERGQVFKETGGSLLVLSPIGSKLLSLGALMAAIERDFPVVYVEALNYKFTPSVANQEFAGDRLVHLWLEGEAYGAANAKV